MFLSLGISSALMLLASIEGVAAGERVRAEGAPMSVALPAGWTLAAGASDVDVPASLFYVFTDMGGGYRALRAQVRLERMRGERVPTSWAMLLKECAETTANDAVCAPFEVAGFEAIETVSRTTMIADGAIEPGRGRRSSRSETVSDDIVVHVRDDFYYCGMTVMPGQDATSLEAELREFCSSLKPSESNAGSLRHG
jgi:hypothetical protein